MKISCLGFLFLLAFYSTSCKKFLDKKPDQRLVVPNSLQDLQTILDNHTVLNSAMVIPNNASDEYYLSFTEWNGLSQYTKDTYVWAGQTDPPTPSSASDWKNLYRSVFYANSVLDHLEEISKIGQEEKWDNIKGQALFHRAYAFYNLAQIYCLQYDSATANSRLGVVLRLTSDYNTESVRVTLQQSYNQIISDLQQAESLIFDLIPTSPETKTRPGKAAVYALLSKCYLHLKNYKKAEESADKTLQLYSVLMDYKSLPIVAPNVASFTVFNPEVIFYNNTIDTRFSLSNAKIDSTLIAAYSTGDLRKSLFYINNGNNTFRFRGSYNGSLTNIFNGIATDEIFLIRAESLARQGKTVAAMNDLNHLLQRRFASSFMPLVATDASQALGYILTERWKELVARGARWEDVRRLNVAGKNITLKRLLNGQFYELPANDLRTAFLIPSSIINTAPTIQQNVR